MEDDDTDLERRVEERTEKLRASEMRFRSVSETAHDAIVCADDAGSITFWNPAAEGIFGYTLGEVLGKSLTILMPERYRERHRTGLARFSLTHVPRAIGRTVELTGLRKDGSEFPIELSLSAWQSGTRQFFTGIIRDITSRKRAESLRAAQLAVSETLAEASSLTDAAPRILGAIREFLQWEVGAVWLVEGQPPELRCASVSAAEHLRGRPFAAMTREVRFERGVGLPGRIWETGRPVAITDVSADSNFPRARVASEDGIRGACGFPIVADKEVVGVLEFMSRELRPPEPDQLDGMRGIGSQIGQFLQRKRAEAALRAEAERLAEAQAIGRIGSWDWDIASDHATCSAEFYRIYALEPKAGPVPCDPLRERIHPDDRERVATIHRASHEPSRPVEFEYRIVLPNGQVRSLWSQARRFVDEAGKTLRMTGVSQDITERRQIEQRLLLRDRMASVGSLASGVTYEINHPLSHVVSNLDLIVEELRQVAGAKPSRAFAELMAMADEAREGAERVRKILGALKTLSRDEAARPVALDVRRVLDSAVTMSLSEIRPRARIVTTIGSVPLVEADEARLGQVFISLLVNAAQALPENQLDKNEIGLATRTALDGRAIIEISDTGPGIPREMLHKVFEPFVTTKPGRGAGLGLTISQGIVSDIGGEITVESVVGKGTTFRVALPAAAAPIVHATALGSPHDASAMKTGKVLVVDDDPMVGRSLRRTLKDRDVTVVGSGREALDRIASGERFDVILCDLMMEEMTGMDLHAELSRRSPELLDRMVFITGGAFAPGARAFLDEVPNERLEKPFEMKNLRALVQRLVGSAQRTTMTG